MKSHPRGHYQNETSEGGRRGAAQSFCETQRLLTAKVMSYNHLPQPFLLACMLSHFSCVRLSATPRTLACQGLLSMEFSRPEYWNGLPCPPPMDLPDPGSEPTSRVSCIWQAGSLPLAAPRKPSAIRTHSSQRTGTLRELAPILREVRRVTYTMAYLEQLRICSVKAKLASVGPLPTGPEKSACVGVEEKGSNAETEPERGGCTHADRTEKEPMACGGS